VIAIAGRYLLNLIERRLGDEPWEDKSVYLFYLELVIGKYIHIRLRNSYLLENRFCQVDCLSFFLYGIGNTTWITVTYYS
jgi:hypothetical protein